MKSDGQQQSQRRGVNWQTISEQLAGSLDEGQLDQQTVDEIIAQRTRELARPPTAQDLDRGLQHLAFHAGTAGFAVELSLARELVKPRWVTTVPGVPPYLAKVIHVGGRIVSVVDLPLLLGLQRGAEAEQPNKVLVIESAGRRLGLFVRQVTGLVSIDVEALSAPSFRARHDTQTAVRGVTPTMTIVLDGALLVDSLRMNRERAMDQGDR